MARSFWFTYESPRGGYQLNCLMEYSAEEKADEINPGYASEARLDRALIGMTNVTALLPLSMIQGIEDAALQYYEDR